nr:MAG: nonstructural protein [Microvirus sp.]
MKLFSVLDIKAGYFLQPFPETSTIAALRGFDTVVNESKSTFNRFPDDFALMEIGTFDQNTGSFTPHEAPQNLGTARTVLKLPHNQNALPISENYAQN